MGISEEQYKLLQNVSHIYVSQFQYTIEGDNGGELRTARRIDGKNAQKFIDSLIDATQAIPNEGDEFYPDFIVRAYSQQELKEESVVDLKVSSEYRGMYVETANERRFCTMKREPITHLQSKYNLHRILRKK